MLAELDFPAKTGDLDSRFVVLPETFSLGSYDLNHAFFFWVSWATGRMFYQDRVVYMVWHGMGPKTGFACLLARLLMGKG